MQQIKAAIYQTQQIRDIERLATERFKLTENELMQRAGAAALHYLVKRWPNAQRIAIFCGGGNNGGDGYVLAMLAQQRNLQVTIWQVGQQKKMHGAAAENLTACQHAGIPINVFTMNTALGQPDLIVDAISGIGLHGALQEEVVNVIDKMHALQKPILALDVPTGIEADTGLVLGQAVCATATITFIGLKLGLITGAGVSYAGEVVLNDLQLPADLFTAVEPVAEKIEFKALQRFLKPRTRDWHKGLSGRVLIVGGDTGYSGAPRMAAMAALRVGAGLVTIATSPHHAELMNAMCPEIMCHGIEKTQDFEPLINRADVVVFGPGLGRSDWAEMIWSMGHQTKAPMVVDADALNLLALTGHQNDNWILTPHPGEAARLLTQTVAVIQQDRLLAASSIHLRYGGTCVLKGAGTIVYSAEGLPEVCDKGNPGMATGGMGDVLSGVIGGLLAQGIPSIEAAKLGVYIHAAAGDMAAKHGERGMIATDLLPFIRQLVNPA